MVKYTSEMILDNHGTGTHASTRVFLLRPGCRRSFLIFKRSARACAAALRRRQHSRDSRVARCFILAGPQRAGYGSLLFAETAAKGADPKPENRCILHGLHCMELNADTMFRASGQKYYTVHAVSAAWHPDLASHFAPSRPRSSIFPDTEPEKIGRTKTPGLGGMMGIPSGAWTTGTLRDERDKLRQIPPLHFLHP